MDMSKYVKMFVSESQEHLQKMDGLLLALEQNGEDRGAIDTFSARPLLKGMSASMGFEELAKVSTGWRTTWTDSGVARGRGSACRGCAPRGCGSAAARGRGD